MMLWPYYVIINVTLGISFDVISVSLDCCIIGVWHPINRNYVNNINCSYHEANTILWKLSCSKRWRLYQKGCLFTMNTHLMVYSVCTRELQWLEHWWLIYHGCFELVLGSLGTNPIVADLASFRMIFILYWKMVYCVHSLESPHWGDSNKNTQYTFMLKKWEKISFICLLTWLYNKPSVARTNFYSPKGVRAIEVRLYIFFTLN